MGPSYNLRGMVACGFEKVFVGHQDDAIQVEFDDCHGMVDGRKEAGLLGDCLLQGVDPVFEAFKQHDFQRP
ncbi:hypothetical protein D3C85_1664240 [compost metagenome]